MNSSVSSIQPPRQPPSKNPFRRQPNTKSRRYVSKNKSGGATEQIAVRLAGPNERSQEEQTKVFVERGERLQDMFGYVGEKFVKLIELIPKELLLSQEEERFCMETVLLHDQQEELKNVVLHTWHKTFAALLASAIEQLLLHRRYTHVQCQGLLLSEHRLEMKSMNYGKAILETSLFEQFFCRIGAAKTYHILIHYVIILKHNGQYIQVAGRPLTEIFSFQALNVRKKYKPRDRLKNGSERGRRRGRSRSQARVSRDETRLSASVNAEEGKNSQQRGKPVFMYSEDKILRYQMFYCSDMNRRGGFFQKNPFFEQGLTKGKKPNLQVKQLVGEAIDDHISSKVALTFKQKLRLTELFIDMFMNFRNLFEVYRSFRNSQWGWRCDFDQLIAATCRLPPNYQDLKNRVSKYKLEKSQDIFQALYRACSDYESVAQLLKLTIDKILPVSLLGKNNTAILKKMMSGLVSMKRFQNYRMTDFLLRMDVHELDWVELAYSMKERKRLMIIGRMYLSAVLSFVLNQILLPLLKYNFYITEKHKEANKIFYYRKPLWTLIAKMAINKFSEDNLESISKTEYNKMQGKNTCEIFPEGKIRILPKKGTFRPIVTFNRKFDVYIEPNVCKKMSLNQILSKTQVVLRNMKNILSEKMGHSVFDNNQIGRKLDGYIRKWRENGAPPLVYFTLDIKKCYDSIDTARLIGFIQETEHIQDFYVITQYSRLYRNKKPLDLVLYGRKSFPFYFNYKERVSAYSVTRSLLEIYNQSKDPAIYIFPAKQLSMTREKIIAQLRLVCDGTIIRYRNKLWQQKIGIPQGLNVSGVLCSLYFASLQKQYVKVEEGLLMRLTDDYIYIGPQSEAKVVLTSLLRCARENGFSFNEDKISKNFYHPQLVKTTESNIISWIGKRINIDNLQMVPQFEISSRLAYSMNVNLTRKMIESNLKNKLKSLLTNHFSSYFKPHLFGFSNLVENVRLYVRVSFEKYLSFLIGIRKLRIFQEQDFILKIIYAAIHEFLLYACSLAGPNSKNHLYHKLYIQVMDQCVLFFKSKRGIRQYPKIQKALKNSLLRVWHAVRKREDANNRPKCLNGHDEKKFPLVRQQPPIPLTKHYFLSWTLVRLIIQRGGKTKSIIKAVLVNEVGNRRLYKLKKMKKIKKGKGERGGAEMSNWQPVGAEYLRKRLLSRRFYKKWIQNKGKARWFNIWKEEQKKNIKLPTYFYERFITPKPSKFPANFSSL